MEQPVQPKPAGGGSGGTGLAPNVASLLCYVGCLLTGIIFLVIEKDNKDVKFHAWQATFLGGTYFVSWIAFMLLAFIPYVGIITGILSIIIYIGLFVVWVVAMIKAYQGERWHIPVLGNLAEQQASK